MSTRRLEVVITGDASGLNRAVGVVQRDMGRVESTTRKLGKGIAIGLGVGIVAAVPLMLKAGDAASDLAEQVNKTGAVFKSSAPQIVEWSKSTSQSLGISQRAALEAAGTFGNMLVPMGFARDRAGEMSQRMVELAADLSSFNNASPEETLDAIRAGLAGESEPLRRFGVFLNDARIKQEALSQGLYSGKGALDANAKAQATYALILKDTADAQGDFARTSDGVANSQRIAKAELENAAATTGAIFVPAMAKVLTVVNQVLLSAQRNWPRFRQATTEAFQAAQRVVAQVMDYYRANIAPTIAAIVGAARGFWRRFGGDITAAFNLARRVVGNTMRGIQAVITGILAVIRGDWSTAWNSLKTVVQTAVSSVLAILRGLPKIVLGIARNVGKALADGIIAGIGDLAGRLRDKITGAFSAVGGLASSLGGKLFSGGPDFQLRRVGAGTATDLSRVDAAGSRRGTQVRLGAEDKARRAGASPEEITRAGDIAYTKARRSTVRRLTNRILARRARLVKQLHALRAQLLKTKVPGKRYTEARAKALDRRTNLAAAISSILDELETIAANYADLQVEMQTLGADLAALNRAEEADGGDDTAAETPDSPAAAAAAAETANPDAQAQVDQANQRAATSQNESRAFGAFVAALRGSGNIDPGGGVVVNQYIEGSMIQEASAATWIVSALGRQGGSSSGVVVSAA